MAYAAAPFTFTPNAAVKFIALPAAFENLNIKSIQLTVVKYGSNDAIGHGYSNGINHVSSFAVSNSTTRKTDYSDTTCVYIQEYNGSTWVNKVAGTVSLDVGEMIFNLSNYDADYYIK